MIYLILAIGSSALISIGMRLSGKYCSNHVALLAVNYLTCTLMAGLYTGVGSLFPRGEGVAAMLWVSLISGVFYLAGFVLFQWNVAKNGVVLPATFMKLGVLVPTALSVLVFHETLSLTRILGFGGALAAIAVIHFEGEKARVSNRWALLLLLLGGGMADAMSKIYEEMCAPALKNQYLFYTFLTALFLCIGLTVLKKQRLGWAELFFGLMVGIPNYFSSRFLLLSLDSVPAVAAFPTFSVGTILVVSCAGRLLFREKLSRRRRVALGIILVSLVLLNL